jgi:hypothetical protein
MEKHNELDHVTILKLKKMDGNLLTNMMKYPKQGNSLLNTPCIQHPTVTLKATT